jgi:predicted permease
MELFFVTFESVITLLGIGLLGFWIIAKKILPASIMGVLPPLVIDIAVPCLVFRNIITKFDPATHSNWWMLPLWWIGFTLLTGLLTLIAVRTAKREFRSEFGLSLFYQNGIFVPLAVLSGMFSIDSPYLVDLFLFTIIYPAFFFNTYHLFFKRKEGSQRLDWKRIRNPILISTVLAVLLKLTGMNIYIPNFFISICDLIGKTAIPLIFIIIGGTIYIDFEKRGKIQIAEMIKFVLFKNFIIAIIVLTLLVIIRPDYNVALIIILQSATPPISAVPLVTERAGGNREIVNQFMFASFLTAALSIPTVIWLFGNFFTK